MMKGIIIVTLFLAIYVQGRPQYENDPTLDDQWEDFKQRYGKKYKDSNETEVKILTLNSPKRQRSPSST